MDASSFKFDYPSVTVFDSASTTGNTFEFLSRGSAIVSIRTKRDLEISGGLRLRAVPPQGVIATIDAATITATNGAYTPNGSFTNLVSSAQLMVLEQLSMLRSMDLEMYQQSLSTVVVHYTLLVK